MFAKQAYTILASSDNPSIVRPKILIVTAHPSIGAALETVLRLEDRYDVRRVLRLADGVALAESWPADVGLSGTHAHRYPGLGPHLIRTRYPLTPTR